MNDWMFEIGGDPLPLTLPQRQPYAPEDASWFATKPVGEEDWLTPLFSSSTLPDVIVTAPPWNPTTPGGGYNPGDYGGWDGHDTSEPWVPTPPPDDECPWAKFYEDAARQVGMLAGVLGAIKDSWITFDPRDDRAIDRALIAIDGLDIMLQSQTISYETAHDSISSLLDIMLSEGTDHLAAVLGAAAGGFVTGLFDGPIPVGEVLGGIGGAIAVYAAGDRLPTAALADAIANLVLAGIDVPPGTPGIACGGS